MTGTEELGVKGGAEKLAVILERLTAVQTDTTKQNNLLDKINSTVSDIRLANVVSQERHAALDARVDHNRTTSDNHDLEQVKLIREEREARELAMLERRRAHDLDITEIKADLKMVKDKQEAFGEKLGSLLGTQRVIMFFTVTATGAIIVAVVTAITGHLGIVVHP